MIEVRSHKTAWLGLAVVLLFLVSLFVLPVLLWRNIEGRYVSSGMDVRTEDEGTEWGFEGGLITEYWTMGGKGPVQSAVIGSYKAVDGGVMVMWLDTEYIVSRGYPYFRTLLTRKVKLHHPKAINEYVFFRGWVPRWLPSLIAPPPK